MENKNAQNTTVKKKKNSVNKEILKRLRRNKSAMFGLFIILVLIFTAIFADFIAPYGIDDQELRAKFTEPSFMRFFGAEEEDYTDRNGNTYLLGTDNLGRDIFSRLVHGSRVSLMVGGIAVSISAITGGLLGALAGYYGKLVDNLIMRFVDVMLAIPSILLAISITSAFGPGLRNVMIAVGIGAIPSYVRIVRASVLSVRGQEFVEAARSIGASDFRIIFRHILPNALSPLIVQATLGVAGAILSAAGLSFIGLGIQPPSPEWGAMLSAGRQYLRDEWYVVMFPGFCIMITIFALNLFGDGLRDALDPRLKR